MPGASPRIEVSSPAAAKGEYGYRGLVEKAVSVLQRHIVPDGLSDHDALTELYGIFDGPEYRALKTSTPAPAASAYEIGMSGPDGPIADGPDGYRQDCDVEDNDD
jgi:hypothetical protein